MPIYDQSFNPAAPVADVFLIHPVTRTRSGPLRGKLDSGADVTVIPEQLVTQLRLSPKGRIWSRGYDGTYSQRLVYYVRFIIEGFPLSMVRCIATNRSTVLVGRNVLNHFVIVLDGKNLTFQVSDR